MATESRRQIWPSFAQRLYENVLWKSHIRGRYIFTWIIRNSSNLSDRWLFFEIVDERIKWKTNRWIVFMRDIDSLIGFRISIPFSSILNYLKSFPFSIILLDRWLSLKSFPFPIALLDRWLSLKSLIKLNKKN